MNHSINLIYMLLIFLKYIQVHMGHDMTKGTLWLSSSKLANVAAAKYYLLRAFPENLKQLSSILTNIYGGLKQQMSHGMRYPTI